jgi:GLPGLI family protein
MDFLLNFESSYGYFVMIRLLIQVLIGCLGAVAFLSSGRAQTLTEGKVQFKMEYLTYSDEVKENPELKKMLPQSFTLYFKDRKNRTEITSLEMGKLVIITNASTGDMTTLLDLPGQKVALEQKGKDVQAQNDTLLQTMTVRETSETRTIAGYKCTKALVNYQMEGQQHEATVWYTGDLPAANNQDFPTIKGFLMEYEEEDEEGMRVKVTAFQVSSEKVEDQLFRIPEGYTTVSEEDFIDAIGK